VAGLKFAGKSMFSLLKSERMGVEAALSGCIREVPGSNFLLSDAARTTCSITTSNQLSLIGNSLIVATFCQLNWKRYTKPEDCQNRRAYMITKYRNFARPRIRRTTVSKLLSI
jgi:hypothetical protein